MKLREGVLVLLTLAGCGGRNFERPSEEALVLGTTTRTEVLKLLGKPTNESTGMRNGKPVQTLMYGYAHIGGLGDGHVTDVAPSRGLQLHFLEDRLVGTQFWSSFEADHTDFDASALPKLVKGSTRRSELLSILGRPGGRSLPPLVEEGHEGWFWGYLHVHPMQRYSKTLVVIVGPDDRVSEATFSEDGKR